MTSADANRLVPAHDVTAGPSVPMGRSILVTFVIAFAAVEWVRGFSLLGGAAGFGLLALAVCLVRPLVDERTATTLPVLVALAVVRLVTVALLPSGGAQYRFGLVAVPILVAAVAVARATSRPSVPEGRAENVEDVPLS